MTTLREAAQQMLKEAEHAASVMEVHLDDYFEAMNNLREALAQGPELKNTYDVEPESLAFFVKSLLGKPGHLDAWIECASEKEIRDHILAYAEFMKGKPVLWKEDDE